MSRDIGTSMHICNENMERSNVATRELKDMDETDLVEAVHTVQWQLRCCI